MPDRFHSIWPIIENSARQHALNPCLVGSLVLTESTARAERVRYEPDYRWLFQPDKVRPKGCTTETETALQKTSWGLMQVMGAVAREHGFTGWLTRLLKPETNLEMGCRHLAWLEKRFGRRDMVVSAYNMGFPRQKADGCFVNQEYVDKVMKRFNRLSAKKKDVAENQAAAPYRFSPSSLKKLKSCHWKLQELFQEVIRHNDCTILEGHRSRQRQEQLVAKGLSQTMNSRHLHDPSLAVDAAPWPLDWNNRDRFIAFGELVKNIAHRMGIHITWGGDWHRFKDFVHFQLDA